MMRFLPLFVSVLLLAAAAGAYAFLSIGTSRNIAAAAAAAETASASGQRQLFQQSVQAFLQDTESNRAELSRFVAKDADVVSLIETIDAAAAREKVSVVIGSVSVGNGDWKYHSPLEVTLSAQGSFAALAAFATDLESLPRASHVVSVSAEATDAHLWFDTFLVDFVKEKPSAAPAALAPKAAP